MKWYRGKLPQKLWAHLVKLGYAGKVVRIPLWPAPPKWPPDIIALAHKSELAGQKVYVPKYWRGFTMPDLKDLKEEKSKGWVEIAWKLRREGKSLRQIAKEVGKSPEAVRKALQKLSQ